MKAYILSIAGMILLSVVVTMIAPSGKMGKFVKGTTRLFILVVMLSPFITWVREGTLTLQTAVVIEEDSDYFSRCAGMIEKKDSAEIRAYILENFDVSADVDVKRKKTTMFELEKITVKVLDDGINGEEERINIMTRVQEALEKRYQCEVVVS